MTPRAVNALRPETGVETGPAIRAKTRLLGGAIRLRRVATTWATPALLVLGTWLLFHPYTGIIHDSRLYVAQALNVLRPDVFGRDLFFLYGSQDSFTLFSTLFAPLVGVLGAAGATLLATVAGQALWLTGICALALRLAPDRAQAVAGVMMLAVLPAAYAGWLTFFFAEGFATPRLLAEALSLWALWALLSDKRRSGLAVAAGLLLGAALLHPLVAAASTATTFVFLVCRDGRWAWLGVAALAGLTIGVALDVTPLDRLGRTMDAEWQAVVAARNLYLFPSHWTTADWSRLAMAAASCLAAACVLDGRARNLVLAALIAGAAGLLAAYIGADLLRDLFVIQIQPYRALWLTCVAAGLGLGFIATRLWRLGPDGRALLALLLFCWLVALAFHPPTGATLAVAALALSVARLSGRFGPLPPFARHLFMSFAAVTVAFLAIYRTATLGGWATKVPDLETLIAVADLPNVIEAAIVAALLALFWRATPRATRRVLPVATLIVALAGFTLWDRRAPWTRVVTESAPPAAFEPHLAADAEIYWEGDVRGAWILLGRPSYVSAAQGGGIAFSRRTALDFRDRAAVMAPLADREIVDVFHASEAPPPPLPALDRRALAEACRADARLDAMVLSRAVPGAYRATWSPPAALSAIDIAALRKGVDQGPVDTFYLYLCGELR